MCINANVWLRFGKSLKILWLFRRLSDLAPLGGQNRKLPKHKILDSNIQTHLLYIFKREQILTVTSVKFEYKSLNEKTYNNEKTSRYFNTVLFQKLILSTTNGSLYVIRYLFFFFRSHRTNWFRIERNLYTNRLTAIRYNSTRNSNRKVIVSYAVS